jgi:hypothetical protein
MAATMKDCKTEVLAGIGRWALKNLLQHRAELCRQMFDDLVKEFGGRYPHHKILTEIWQEAREPKEIQPLDVLHGSLLGFEPTKPVDKDND